VVQTPQVDNVQTPQPVASGGLLGPVTDYWIKALRELGSFALIAWLVVSWNVQTQAQLGDLQRAQVEQTQAVTKLTEAVDRLAERVK
jgi:hypothetical protein